MNPLSIFFRTVTRHWRSLQTNRLIALSTRGVFLFTFVSLLFFLWRTRFLPPEVPLWYSRPWGQDQLAHPLWLLMLPTGSLLWYGLNLVIATYVTAEYLIFTQVLFLTSLLASFLASVTLIKILFLVT